MLNKGNVFRVCFRSFHKQSRHSSTSCPSSSSSSAVQLKSDTTTKSEPVIEKGPFSSLYVNSRYANQMISVIKPHFKLQDYLDQSFVQNLRQNLQKRDLDGQFDLDDFQENVKLLLLLKEQLDTLKGEFRRLKQSGSPKLSTQQLDQFKQMKADIAKLNERILDLEELVMPIVLRLPNTLRSGVGEDYDLIEVKKITPTRKLFKLLDAKKISYIHEIRKSSIIGPSCDFLIGDGARMSQGIRSYFKKSMRNFLSRQEGEVHEMSGLDFVKSAIVEACNDHRERPFEQDRLRLNRGVKTLHDSQQMHLAGHSSLEAVCAMLSKRHVNRESLPLRFLQDGASYDQSMRQINSIHLSSVTLNEQSKANAEYDSLVGALWECYSQLQLPVMLCKSSSRLMQTNQYASHEILIYFPCAREWMKVAELNHYGNYLPARLGLEDLQMIGGSLVDANLLVDAILENTQDDRAKYEVPACIRRFM